MLWAFDPALRCDMEPVRQHVRPRGVTDSKEAAMGGSVTIRVRSIILVLVVALVALAAYLVGSSHNDSAVAAATPGGAVARTVTMTGKGVLTAVPDELTFHLAVVRTEDDVSTALDSSS